MADTAILVAVIASLLVGYTYVGYPMLIAGLGRILRMPRRSLKRRYEPTVSICMTVHNGEAHLAKKLESLLALDYPSHKLEYLVYCDGCTDQTVAISRDYASRDPRIRVFSDEERRGKPHGLNQLAKAARGDVLVLTDVRPALARRAVKSLVRMFRDPSVGCVSGNLVLDNDTGAGAYWLYEKFIRGCEARLGGLVGVSGTIYAIRREDFPVVPNDIILDDMWVPLQVVLRKRQKIAFSPSARAYEASFSDDREFARKVRTLAGNYQLLSRMPELLLPGINPVWFQIVSHKLLRLTCPWALLLLLASSSVVASVLSSSEASYSSVWFWRSLVLAQLAFYAAAWLGGRAGRIGVLARSFVVLNAAAVVGLWRFLRGSQKITW